MSSCRTVFLEIIRRPSVPSASFQPASQQASCVDRGFDFSIASFPLLCLNSDGDRLCPSIAEPTASVPPFALALPRSRTLQTRSGALSRSNTASNRFCQKKVFCASFYPMMRYNGAKTIKAIVWASIPDVSGMCCALAHGGTACLNFPWAPSPCSSSTSRARRACSSN